MVLADKKGTQIRHVLTVCDSIKELLGQLVAVINNGQQGKGWAKPPEDAMIEQIAALPGVLFIVVDIWI